MLSEPTLTAVASSWTGLFAALWFARHPIDATVRPPTHPDRRRRTPSSRVTDGKRRRDRPDDRARVDLYAPAPAPSGAGPNDAVAFPVDTPRRLEATIETVARRLLALPETQHLGHRSIRYRAQLQRTLLQSLHALARLDEGTFGICVACSSPISLATLNEEPWTQVCVRCARST